MVETDGTGEEEDGTGNLEEDGAGEDLTEEVMEEIGGLDYGEESEDGKKQRNKKNIKTIIIKHNKFF